LTPPPHGLVSEARISDHNRIIWITGGSSGIGFAAAEALVGNGRTIVLSARREGPLKQARTALSPRDGAVDYVAMNASDPADVQRAHREIVRRHGNVDVLINSAGLSITDKEWPVISPAGFDTVIAANLSGTFYATLNVLGAMRERRRGLIINIVSGAGRYVYASVGPAYTAAKHGVFALTAQLNMSELSNGIRACAFCPGEVATPLLNVRRVPPTPEQLEQMLQPDEVGRIIAFIVNLPPSVHIGELLVNAAPTFSS
jgi:NADP-dependent 3-hydroxy acid dehydrogenase YdfG